jgi:hypothetical protein
MKWISIIFATSFLTVAFSQCDEVDSLNLRIVELAKSKLGKKVYRGECWDLARFVLEETNSSWDGLYEYGKLLDKSECLMPGDIIQFKNVKIQYKIGRTTYTEIMTHHTALIYDVKSDDEVILIHQNTAMKGKKVVTSPLIFSTIVKGSYKIYRPIKS